MSTSGPESTGTQGGHKVQEGIYGQDFYWVWDFVVGQRFTPESHGPTYRIVAPDERAARKKLLIINIHDEPVFLTGATECFIPKTSSEDG